MKIAKRVRLGTTFFTCHNIAELPFKKRFDLALCKNILHHIQSPREMAALVQVLRRVAQNLIIVEITDPKRFRARNLRTWLPKLFNLYYENFLGDGLIDREEHRYFDKRWLEKFCCAAFQDLDWTVQELSTVKGTYLIAKISQPEPKRRSDGEFFYTIKKESGG